MTATLRALSVPLLLGAGAMAGHLVASGWPAAPRPSYFWHFWIAAIAAAAGCLEVLSPSRGRRWIRRTLASTSAPWLLLRVLVGPEWSPTEGMLWIAGMALGILALWTVIDGLAMDRLGPSTPLILLVAASGAAPAIALSASERLGYHAAALAAPLAIWAVLAWLRPSGFLAHGAAAPFALILGGILIDAHIFAFVRPVLIIPLALSAPLGLAARRLTARRWPRASVPCGLLAAVLCAGAAVFIAWREIEDSGGF